MKRQINNRIKRQENWSLLISSPADFQCVVVVKMRQDYLYPDTKQQKQQQQKNVSSASLPVQLRWFDAND